MLHVLDYLLLCCVDFENKISIYLSVFMHIDFMLYETQYLGKNDNKLVKDLT